MKRLTLIAMQSDKAAILEALQAAGAVQIISAAEPTGEEADLAKLENRVQRLSSAQLLLKPLAPKAKMGPKPEKKLEELRAGMPAALQFCEEVEGIDHDLAAVRNDMDKRQALSESLLPWSELDTRIENIKSTNTTKYLTGMLTDEAVAKLKEENLDIALEVYGGTEKARAVLIACNAADYADVQARVKALDFAEFSFGALTGTAAENIQRMQAETEADKKREEELVAKLKTAAESRPVLCHALDEAVIDRDREAAKQELGATGTTFIMEGWVRADETEKVEAAAKSVTDACYCEFREAEEEENEPVVLKNHKLIEPYQAVTNLYSLPDYNSVDATPLFAVFYFIFFGMMLSDTGYGFVLAVGCYLFLKLLKPQGMMRQLAGVLCMGGISTIVMGLFFGCLFGVPWSTVFKGLPFENTFPFIDSSAQPIQMLALCAGMGIVHMYFGVCIATWECIKKGDWIGAIGDHFAWLTCVTGLLMLAAPMIGMPQAVATAGKWIAIVSGVILFLAGGRESKSIGGKVASGAFNCYNITGWLGDVLSYARVFALGLSTGVIGLVLNTLGGMLYGAFQNGAVLQAIGFIITGVLLVFLHAFMMAINTLGTFVHTARLQYVEFFGKFYEAGGKPFKPLKYNSKFVQVDD
ncbi:MAG: V-type ATP synthase subunit I [Clostridia bacterium]|nr:V-type ATP synthase subunit I [Clostridia bacterium]